MGSTPKPTKPPGMSAEKVQQNLEDEIRRQRQARGHSKNLLSDMYSSMKDAFGA